MITNHDQTSGNYSGYAAFLPYVAREQLARGNVGEYVEERSALALFADITGFSSLTEQLTRDGHRGSEAVTDLLNRCFGEMIDVVHERGGDVLDFGGDALLGMWNADDWETSLLAASDAALAIAARPFEVEGAGPLRFRVGVGAGKLTTVHVGAEEHGRHFVPLGSAVRAACDACALAPVGQVVLRCSHNDVLPAALHVQRAGLGAWHVTHVRTASSRPSVPPAFPEQAAQAYVSKLVQSRALGEYREIDARWASDLREVSVGFLGLRGGDGDLPSATELRAASSRVQRVLAELDGDINQITTDDKGLVLLFAFGLPFHAHDDDALRATVAAKELAHEMTTLGLHSAVGVASGRAFCGAYGNAQRRRYAMVGQVVNRAARLMAAAAEMSNRDLSDGDTPKSDPPNRPPSIGAFTAGVLVDEETQRRAGQRGALHSVGTLSIKGEREAIRAYAPLPTPNAESHHGAEPIASVRLQRVVGLSLQLERLEHRLLVPSGALICLEAEAGMGKSTLLAAFSRRAAKRGYRTLTGTGDAIDKFTPYTAWHGILQTLVDVKSDAGPSFETALGEQLGLEPQQREWLPLLFAVVPWITPDNRVLPDNQLVAQMAPQQRAEATRALLLALLRATLGPQDIIVMDDAQWIDSASWALLSQLRRSNPEQNLLIATRPRDRDAATELNAFLESTDTEWMSIEPLDAEQSVQLAAATLGVREIAPEVARFITNKGGGYPLLVAELATTLVASGSVELRLDSLRLKDAAVDLEAMGFPDRLHGLIMARLDGLSASHLIVAKIASVLGMHFTRAALRALCPKEMDDPALDMALAALEEAHLTVGEPGSPDVRYAFRHAIVHEAVYQMTPFSQRRELHRSAAKLLQEQQQQTWPSTAALLALHFRRAEDWVNAVHYMDAAAEHALERGGSREAAVTLRQLLQLLDEHPEVRREHDAVWQAGVWRRLGEAYFALGELVNSEYALERSLRLLGHGNRASTWGRALWFGFDMLAQVFHLVLPERWVRSSNAAVSLNAARSLRLLAVIEYYRLAVFGHMACALGAVNLAERGGLYAAAGGAYANLGFVAGMLRWDGLLARYLQRGRQTREVRALCELDFAEGLVWMVRGRLPRAMSLFERGFGRAQRVSDTLEMGVAHTLLGIVNAYAGLRNKAVAEFTALLRLASLVGNRTHQLWARSSLLSLHIHTADLPTLERMQRELQDGLSADPRDPAGGVKNGLAVARAYVEFRRGRFVTAEREGVVALDVLTKASVDFSLLGPLTDLVKLFQALFNRTRSTTAKRAVKRSLRLFGRCCRLFPIWRPRWYLLQARFARLLGERNDAHYYVNLTQESCTKYGLPLEAALALYEQGLQQEELDGDPIAGARLRAQAELTLRDLGFVERDFGANVHARAPSP